MSDPLFWIVEDRDEEGASSWFDSVDEAREVIRPGDRMVAPTERTMRLADRIAHRRQGKGIREVSRSDAFDYVLEAMNRQPWWQRVFLAAPVDLYEGLFLHRFPPCCVAWYTVVGMCGASQGAFTDRIGLDVPHLQYVACPVHARHLQRHPDKVREIVTRRVAQGHLPEYTLRLFENGSEVSHDRP